MLWLLVELELLWLEWRLVGDVLVEFRWLLVKEEWVELLLLDPSFDEIPEACTAEAAAAAWKQIKWISFNRLIKALKNGVNNLVDTIHLKMSLKLKF